MKETMMLDFVPLEQHVEVVSRWIRQTQETDERAERIERRHDALRRISPYIVGGALFVGLLAGYLAGWVKWGLH